MNLIVKGLDLGNVKTYFKKLTDHQRNSITYKYGKILDLFSVPMQKEAITTLAQFYDPTLRCFQFQDFQLVHTIEEFSKIMQSHKPTNGPYRQLGYIPTLKDMVTHLDICASDLEANLRTRGDLRGF